MKRPWTPTSATDQKFVWNLLEDYTGRSVRAAETTFVGQTVRGHWPAFKAIAGGASFHAISAMRAIRILNTKPERTPGIAQRAWGTGARAETNVHVSRTQEMIPWSVISDRIANEGLWVVLKQINRTRQELVHDPEV